MTQICYKNHFAVNTLPEIGIPHSIYFVMRETFLGVRYIEEYVTNRDGVPVRVEIEENASARTFVYQQSSAETEWTVNHNLGFKPSVQFIGIDNQIGIVDVLHLSVNQLKVFFAAPTAGLIRCN